MNQATYVINGRTYRGFVWWSYRTAPPTLEGMTYEHALKLDRQYRNTHLPAWRVPNAGRLSAVEVAP